jgi:HEAT repeat protein
LALPLLTIIAGIMVAACSRDVVLVPENKPLSPESVRAVEQLKSPDARERWEATQALGDLGPEVELAAPALIEALKTEQVAGLRWGYVWALGQIGPAAPGVVDTLAEALSDPDDHVRHEAAKALGSMGKAARSALPALEAARGDENSVVDDAIEAAIERVG